MVTGKRHAEQIELGDASGAHRSTLEAYSTSYLGFVRAVSASVMVTAYCLWAFESAASTGDETWFRLSIIPFVLAVLRYAHVIEQGKGGAPEEIVLSRPCHPGPGPPVDRHLRDRRQCLTRESPTPDRMGPHGAHGRDRGRPGRRRRGRRAARAGRPPWPRRARSRPLLRRRRAERGRDGASTRRPSTWSRDLDLAAGTIRVDAGVSLDTLMRLLLPFGFFVPVTPGTRSRHRRRRDRRRHPRQEPPRRRQLREPRRVVHPPRSEGDVHRRRPRTTPTCSGAPPAAWGSPASSPRRPFGCSRSRRRSCPSTPTASPTSTT